MVDKEVYTFNEVTGTVELSTTNAPEDGGRVSPTSSPTTPHHSRKTSRSPGLN